MHLPYTANWDQYERVEGEIVVNGVYYTYVKRKISNNTLYLLCLPNNDKTHYNNLRHQLAGRANGQTTPDGQPANTVKKGVSMPELQQPVNNYQLASCPETLVSYAMRCLLRVDGPSLPQADKPPRWVMIDPVLA
ncbi:hypothetical protein [Paraflavitalea pollutisoli]|uniref:hypothetical protein n=1 Tax=Paraflavitalea pollutisoli TaxID=3034143 RepID=UPI0023EBD16C|nr:hypothetical protein [Paraflavitalea sp. H1-2-19X]